MKSLHTYLISSFFLLIVILLGNCKKEDPAVCSETLTDTLIFETIDTVEIVPPAQFIMAIPNSGIPGDTIKIIGNGWNLEDGNSNVLFGETSAEVIEIIQGTVLCVKIPDLADGEYQLTVEQDSDEFPGVSLFSITSAALLSPIYNGLAPSEVIIGDTVEIYGVNFQSGSVVSINGTPGTFIPELSNEYIISFEVPNFIEPGIASVWNGVSQNTLPDYPLTLRTSDSQITRVTPFPGYAYAGGSLFFEGENLEGMEVIINGNAIDNGNEGEFNTVYNHSETSFAYRIPMDMAEQTVEIEIYDEALLVYSDNHLIRSTSQGSSILTSDTIFRESTIVWPESISDNWLNIQNDLTELDGVGSNFYFECMRLSHQPEFPEENTGCMYYSNELESDSTPIFESSADINDLIVLPNLDYLELSTSDNLVLSGRMIRRILPNGGDSLLISLEDANGYHYYFTSWTSSELAGFTDNTDASCQ